MPLAANDRTWCGKNLQVDILFTRAGVAQQIVITAHGRSVLIDTGDGTLRDLLAAGIRLDTIDGIIYTHGHFDHVGGLHPLLGFLRMIGRQTALPVYAPERSTEAFAIVHNFRRCYPDSVPFEIQMRELHRRQKVELGALSIESYPVAHAGSIAGGGILEPIPAFGYRISCGEETVAITGDTGMCKELPDLVRGADLAILEATFATAEGFEPEMFTRVHLSEQLAHDLGGLAKEYILVHRAERDE